VGRLLYVESFPGRQGSISDYLEGARCLLKILKPNGEEDNGFSFRENGDLMSDNPSQRRSIR
jgi:hypothetical protein